MCKYHVHFYQIDHLGFFLSNLKIYLLNFSPVQMQYIKTSCMEIFEIFLVLFLKIELFLSSGLISPVALLRVIAIELEQIREVKY